ncbi:PTS sugar transporter subunit IIA [Vogesella indigofera]|jgi:PTS system ascorbate-specific IIA component|uniref:PTS sugar transporter subunit IIA n=1 Tax=Vogesella indigofera TaxID=45465 RepID=UPI000F9FD0E5|nr:PTS fructose transporter subunit IIA [Vogesella indigofera]MDC7702214.1 PTS fructose transporter subunit IIA [Vogesella indigofera]MDC7704654.1 PTS fructose transporter subunit IIA [Vogesella indigofera]MDC7711131.1 PTS fructose transporter subunit IIA [Vogesella indigofera]
MVGVLIISHGELGLCLADCARHVLGRVPDNLAILGVEKQDNPDARLLDAQALIDKIDDGSGVLVLSDMLGGTPCNIASRLRKRGVVEVVAGVNLPMLVRALSYSAQPLEVVVSKAITGGLEGVYYVIPEGKE